MFNDDFSPAEDRQSDLEKLEKAAEVDPDGLKERLVPADVALGDWPSCRVDETEEARFRGGQAVRCDVDGEGLTRVYGPGKQFLGIGELGNDGTVAPKRIFLTDD